MNYLEEGGGNDGGVGMMVLVVDILYSSCQVTVMLKDRHKFTKRCMSVGNWQGFIIDVGRRYWHT